MLPPGRERTTNALALNHHCDVGYTLDTSQSIRTNSRNTHTAIQLYFFTIIIREWRVGRKRSLPLHVVLLDVREQGLTFTTEPQSIALHGSIVLYYVLQNYRVINCMTVPYCTTYHIVSFTVEFLQIKILGE